MLQFFRCCPRFANVNCERIFLMGLRVYQVVPSQLTVFSPMQVKPPCSFTPEETNYLTDRIQNGGTEVVEVSLVSSMLHSFEYS